MRRLRSRTRCETSSKDYDRMKNENELISLMLPEIDLISSDDDMLVDQINYRGLSFSIWKASSGIYYTCLAGKFYRIPEPEGGYRRWIESQIDIGYGMIKAWPEFKAMLVEKPNPIDGDLFLIQDGRIIKVYLTYDNYNEEECVRMAEADLFRYISLMALKKGFTKSGN